MGNCHDVDGRGMVRWFAERPVSELRPGDHAWLAFAGREEQERVIGTFVRDGLTTAEKVVYISDAAPGSLPGVRTLDPRPFTESGQLRVLPRERSCLSRGRFDPDLMIDTLRHEVDTAFDQGFRAVRLTTDFSWALREPGGAGTMLGCEHRFEAAVAPSTMTMAICQVDRGSCTPDELLALRNTHEVLVEVNPEFDDGILRIVRTFSPHGLRLEGELDAARHTVFSESLSTVARGDSQVHLDFARLRFIDLGALRLLARHAMRSPGRGQVILDNMPADLEDVIEMVGWHRLPGLVRGRGGDA